MAKRGLTVVLILAAAAMTGCVPTGYCCRPSSCAATAPAPPLPLGPRGTTQLDLSALGAMPEQGRISPQVSAEAQYRLIEPPDCQCLAARHSAQGNLLDSEVGLTESAGGHCQAAACAAALGADLIRCRSADERNKSAAQAMQAFYALAEAEGQVEVLHNSLAELQQSISNVDELRAKGLPVPMDDTALRRQRAELEAQLGDTRLTIGDLNGKLRLLLGADCGDQSAFWPAADLIVDTVPIDVDAAVQLALCQRADLAIVRLCVNCLSSDTLSVVSGMLHSVMGLSGGPSTPKGILGTFCGKDDSAELCLRQSQLYQLLVERERAAVEEIRLAATTVEARLMDVRLAKLKHDLWQQRVEQLIEKRRADGATVFDISAAKLETLKAQSDLLHKVVAWKLAVVDLKRAQGSLAAECGFVPPSTCRPCCP